MAYRGTFATYGRARGVVTATGMKTELGKIAGMLQEAEETKTPLQKRLAVFGQKLAIAVLVICAIVFAAGIMRGEGPLLMLLTAISLAVAAIPEALPAVITISLALGAKSMVVQNALIRKLPAVETLGSVTYICSDKTGTLTMNKMSVEEIYTDDALIKIGGMKRDGKRNPDDYQASVWNHLMTGLALSNDADMDRDKNLIGDPTETALHQIAAINGFNKKDLSRSAPCSGTALRFGQEVHDHFPQAHEKWASRRATLYCLYQRRPGCSDSTVRRNPDIRRIEKFRR